MGAEQLVENGVAFYDFSRVFRDRSDEIFSDHCCHLDRRGYRLLAAEMGRTVLAHSSERARNTEPQP